MDVYTGIWKTRKYIFNPIPLGNGKLKPVLLGYGKLKVNLKPWGPHNTKAYQTQLNFTYEGLFNMNASISIPIVVQPMPDPNKTVAKCLKFTMDSVPLFDSIYEGQGALEFQVQDWQEDTITGVYSMKSLDPKSTTFPEDCGEFQLSRVKKAKHVHANDLVMDEDKSRCSIL